MGQTCWQRIPSVCRTLATDLTAVFLLLAVLGCRQEQQKQPEPAGQPAPESVQPFPESGETSGHLATGGSERYDVELADGEFVRVEVRQEHVDVQVAVDGPAEEQDFVFDLPVGRNLPERVCLVADGAGLYSIRVSPFGNKSGDYTLRLLDRRTATDDDRLCARATRLFADAERQKRTKDPALLAGDDSEASRLWQRSGDVDLAALALREAGSHWHHLGRNASAADTYRQALALARSAGNPFLEATSLNSLGITLRDRGELAAAAEAHAVALRIAREMDNLALQASVLNNLGLVDEARGEPHRAIGRYGEALALWRELGASNDVDLTKTLKNLADTYARLDHHDQALYLLEEVEEIVQRLGRQDLMASLLMSRGWVHHLRGRPGEAVADLRTALGIARRGKNANRTVAILDRLGTAQAANGDPGAAMTSYQESLALSEQSESPRDAANTKINIGCLHAETGEGDKALLFLDEARVLFTEIDDPRALTHLDYCTARAMDVLGDPDAALRWVSIALQHVDRMRDEARLLGERYRPIWLWQAYAEYEIELLMEKYRRTGEESFARAAFEASDLARARNFLELVVESANRPPTPARQDLLEQLLRVRQALNAGQRERRQLLVRGAPDADFATVERRLDASSLTLERLRATIRRVSGRGLGSPEPVAVAELQDLLDPRTVLLSYVLGETRSFLFVVGDDSFRAWELDPAASVNHQADVLYKALKRSRGRGYQHFLTAQRLREMILPDGAIPDGTQRLIILPADVLHYIPFAVLPSPGQENGEARLLGDDFETLYLPSASVLAALRRREAVREPPPRTVYIYADAVYSSDDPRVQGAAAEESSAPVNALPGDTDRLPGGALPRLPATQREAADILSLVSGEDGVAAFDFDVSKDAVFAAPLYLYRIVHFATHAEVDETFPDLSGLVLSRVDAEGRSVDGDLYLHEIYSLRLAADLVVLSGCRTALGKRIRGNGVVSMTRGFLYAGSSQVLVSLWSVDDDATAELMAEFYRGLLSRGESPASALRSAQRWMRTQERWRAPYYWAAFVLQGDG